MRIKIFQITILVLSVLSLNACAEVELASHVAKKTVPVAPTQGTFKVGTPYQIKGKTYRPSETYNFEQTGIASWYGPNFHGKRTANGETFDMNELTAAHKTLQMPSLIRVTNLENGKSVVLRVNDRGPFSRGRVLDVSKRGAELLGFKNQGTAKVKIQLLPNESRQIAQAAKEGRSTRGVEMAMNEDGYQPISQRPRTMPSQQYPERVTPAPVPEVEVADLHSSSVPGHVNNGKFYPDPVVKKQPVYPTNIYVQTGSFGNPANAEKMAYNLREIGNAHVMPAMVNGQNYYRVRIGPLANVPEADTMLERLAAIGKPDAIVVVD